jgi:hypothetical protein
VYQQTAKKIAMLLYDSVLYGGQQYREYLNPEDIKGRVFNVKIEILPDDKERQFIEAMIQTALSAGMIEFEDAFRIRSIKNTKLAEMYMSKAKKRKEKAEMEKAQMNSQMNAQSQQQSVAAKAQADMQLEQMTSQGKLAVVQTEMTMKKDLVKQQFVQEALMKSFELGKPLSPELQQIVMSYLQEEQQQKEMAEQAAMQQQEQAMQQQAAEQGMEQETQM